MVVVDYVDWCNWVGWWYVSCVIKLILGDYFVSCLEIGGFND